MSPTLEASGIHKYFGGVKAVQGVSMTLEVGRVVGLIGPNGSGKSTLLNVLAGVEKPTKGTLTVDGRRVDRWPAYRMVGLLGIAKTHQIPKPFLAMTCRENVAVARMYGNRRNAEPASSLDESLRILALVGLDRRADAPASNLTVQERKRLEFARVLATGAGLVLLDEIFAGLSPEELRDAIALFARVQKDQGFGALIVEHVMRAVMTLSDHVVVIEDGRKIAEGSPKEVVENPAVSEAYLGTEATDATP